MSRADSSLAAPPGSSDDDPPLVGPLDRILSEADLRLFELIEVGVMIFDVDGRVAWANAAAERMNGRAREDMIGHHFSELIAEDRRELTIAQFKRKVEDAVVTEFETALVDPRGRRSVFKSCSYPLWSEGQIVGVLAFGYELGPDSRQPGLPERWPQLTPRRRQILKLLAEGLSTVEISVELVLSEQTVRNHVRDVLKQLGAHSRLEAVNMAWRLGLLGPDERSATRRMTPCGPGVSYRLSCSHKYWARQ